MQRVRAKALRLFAVAAFVGLLLTACGGGVAAPEGTQPEQGGLLEGLATPTPTPLLVP